ncbi:MAG: hypothetical protein CSA18_03110 [Deltaproteobacteria bacterium]|nr:MAG: hypothetical protein CSA18_03110 [Deltaproteobacteria bacterium]
MLTGTDAKNNCRYKMKKIYWLFIFIFIISGCLNKDKVDNKTKSLVSVGSSHINTSDFEAAFEVIRLGYSDLSASKEDMTALKQDILVQLIEEQLVINEAQAHGLVYTQENFEEELKKIKSEYPDNVFEEMLEKNAIEYSLWEIRFKREMILKRALKLLVKDKVVVEDKELRQTFIDYCKENSFDPAKIKINGEISSVILKRLKRNKSEKDYDKLLKILKDKFEISINENNWAEVLNAHKY